MITRTSALNLSAKGNRRPQIRRRFIPQYIGEGFAGGRIRSLTIKHGPWRHPLYDRDTWACTCDCEDFHFRHQRFAPTIHFDRHWCKHIRRMVRRLVRRGQLPPSCLLPQLAPCCTECGLAEVRVFAMCDETGLLLEGRFICELCVRNRQLADSGVLGGEDHGEDFYGFGSNVALPAAWE